MESLITFNSTEGPAKYRTSHIPRDPAPPLQPTLFDKKSLKLFIHQAHVTFPTRIHGELTDKHGIDWLQDVAVNNFIPNHTDYIYFELNGNPQNTVLAAFSSSVSGFTVQYTSVDEMMDIDEVIDLRVRIRSGKHRVNVGYDADDVANEDVAAEKQRIAEASGVVEGTAMQWTNYVFLKKRFTPAEIAKMKVEHGGNVLIEMALEGKEMCTIRLSGFFIVDNGKLEIPYPKPSATPQIQ